MPCETAAVSRCSGLGGLEAGSRNGSAKSVIDELAFGLADLLDRTRDGGAPMSRQQPEAFSAGEFEGFDKARCIMWCHETRARVFKRLELTSFIVDTSVEAVHVDNTTRGDRVFLTAFDDEGRRVSADTLPVVEPCDHLAVAAEFDHDYTEMTVTPGSELEEVVAREDGWVVNMEAVRDYDVVADRRATQKAVVLAHLPDLMQSGEARGFVVGPDESDGAGTT